MASRPLVNYEFKEYAGLAELHRALPSVEANGVEGDPAFAGASSFDFRLSATSPARKAGAYLTEVTFDCRNAMRPAGTIPDVGAFVYDARTTH